MRALDVCAAGAFALGAAIAWTGGGRFRLGDLRVSLTDPGRAILWGVGLVALRWGLWRRVPPPPAVPLARLPAVFPTIPQSRTRRIHGLAGRGAAAARAAGRTLRRTLRPAVREAARAWPPLAAASALVVAQPLLDTIARRPQFLIAHDAQPADILLVAAGSVLLLPTLLTVAVFLARGAGPRARRVVESVLIGAFATLFVLQLAKYAGGQTAAVVIPLAVAGGLAATAAYDRVTIVRTLATVSSLSVLVVPVLFIATPAIRHLWIPAKLADTPRPRYADAAVRNGTDAPVVLIIVDETPLVSLLDADRKIDASRYPAFASLARDGILFRNATTVSDYTEWAVPAILSGRYPRAGKSPIAADHPDTLFTLLAGTYRFETREYFTALCPPDLCPQGGTPLTTRMALLANDLLYVYLHVIAPPDLAKGLPALTDSWRDFGDLGAWRRQVRQRRDRRRPGRLNVRIVEDFIARIRDGAGPTLFMFHTLLQHAPHLQLPSGLFNGTRAPVPAFATGETWNEDEWAVGQLYQRHLLQLQFVDAMLGRLLDRLRSTGLYERALVVVTADHGISFEPATARRDFSDRTAAEIMRVPLLINLPDAAAITVPSMDVGGQHVSDRNAQTIDILPTIADVLGVPLPWRVDGVSLVDPSVPEPEAKTVFYQGAARSRTFDRRGPDLSAALRRQLAVCGGDDNPYCLPRPDRFEPLVGQPIRALRVVGGGGAVEIDGLSRFRNYRRTGDEIPFDVAGRLERVPAEPGEPTYLAVAVNGVVRAVTHTWDSEPRRWQATPPPTAWRQGRNDLEVFVIEDGGPSPLLRRCEPVAGSR